MLSRTLSRKFRRIIRFYIHHRNYFQKGNGEFEVLESPIKLFLLISVYIKVMLGNSPWVIPLIITIIIARIVFFWLLGMLWDKIKAYHIEQEWSNKRNDFVKDMRERFK